MSKRPLDTILHHLRKQVAAQHFSALTDRELLERFIDQCDEAAFAALVHRHGGLVLGVCRRILAHAQDAEDACQATFLVLVRRAAAIRRRDSLASWLHGVAYRIANKLRTQRQRYRTSFDEDRPGPTHDPSADLSWRELLLLLDAELQRLPEKLRQPLILCYLAGKTRDEAAQQLRCTVDALKGRLERGRGMLRTRLLRRGVTLPAALGTAVLAPGAASAGMPSLLAIGTVRAAVGWATGHAAAETLSPTVASLAEWGAAAMVSKMKIAVYLLAAAAFVGTAAGTMQYRDKKPAPSTPAVILPTEAIDEAAGPPQRDSLPAGAMARLGSTRLRHGGTVSGLAVSPDGTLLASVSYDWTFRLWERSSGKEVATFMAQAWLLCVAFAPDGQSVAAGGDETDPGVYLYDVRTRRHRHFGERAGGVRALAFAPDGHTLATGNKYGTIQWWNIATGKELCAWQAHEDEVQALAVTTDGRTIISSGVDGAVHLWDAATGLERAAGQERLGSDVSIVLSPDGRWFASGGADGVVRLRTVTDGTAIRQFRGDGTAIRALAITRDGQTVIAGDAAGKISCWDFAGAGQPRRFSAHYGTIRAIGLTPDGRALVTASEDHRLRLWDLSSGTELLPQSGHDGPLAALAMSRQGTMIATGGWDRTARLWDGRTQREVQRIAGFEDIVTAVAFTADGGTLIAADQTGRLHWCDTVTGAVRHKHQGHWGFIIALAVSPDGRCLASAGRDQQIRLWDTKTGQLLRQWPAHSRWIRALAFAPDGKALASGASDWWDPATGLECAPALRHPRAVTSLCFAPDGRQLATACADGEARVWDVASGAMRYSCEPYQVGDWAQTTVAYSPDGRLLAVGSGGKNIWLRDAADGKRLHGFPGHSGWIWGLTFAPDGRTVLSASEDTTVLFWDLATVPALREYLQNRDDLAQQPR
jgi:RNA polymerase sigma factor (sigma-70 family)